MGNGGDMAGVLAIANQLGGRLPAARDDGPRLISITQYTTLIPRMPLTPPWQRH